ncbi:hypothetical protein FD754_016225 [Muntiacus muntjak]|uniref:EF-hand domain-containing protein n=1 Tax=Muntiacus muntjak TaxID=9888 RepID=A0A5N3VQS8_MUNMU|nr:hypothetical protein FD754_016225 [Muntiacus muntjak]
MAGPQQQPPYLHLAELTATQFLEIWKHFDADGNGYIEGKELENFFQELEKARKGSGMVSKSDNLGEKMKEFMQKYDKNSDGKIEMAELAQILPTEENFLLCFRQHVGSSTEFMEVRPRRCLLSCTLGPAFLSPWVKYLFASLGFFENLMVGFLSMRRNILMKLGIFSPKKVLFPNACVVHTYNGILLSHKTERNNALGRDQIWEKNDLRQQTFYRLSVSGEIW